MIELLIGMLGICTMISLASLLAKLIELVGSYPGKHTSRQIKHREEIQRKRAARYESNRYENDWRHVA